MLQKNPNKNPPSVEIKELLDVVKMADDAIVLLIGALDTPPEGWQRRRRRRCDPIKTRFHQINLRFIVNPSIQLHFQKLFLLFKVVAQIFIDLFGFIKR